MQAYARADDVSVGLIQMLFNSFRKELDVSIRRGAQISPHFLLSIETAFDDADFYQLFAKMKNTRSLRIV